MAGCTAQVREGRDPHAGASALAPSAEPIAIPILGRAMNLSLAMTAIDWSSQSVIATLDVRFLSFGLYGRVSWIMSVLLECRMNAWCGGRPPAL